MSNRKLKLLPNVTKITLVGTVNYHNIPTVEFVDEVCLEQEESQIVEVFVKSQRDGDALGGKRVDNSVDDVDDAVGGIQVRFTYWTTLGCDQLSLFCFV